MPNDWDIHAVFDGFVVTFDGIEVSTWPTLTGAARGLTLAKQAQADLLHLLTNTLARKEA